MVMRADFLKLAEDSSEDWSYSTILKCIQNGQWSINIRDVHIRCGFSCNNFENVEGFLRTLQNNVLGFNSTQVPNLRHFA